jgi:hypothetical protein
VLRLDAFCGHGGAVAAPCSDRRPAAGYEARELRRLQLQEAWLARVLADLGTDKDVSFEPRAGMRGIGDLRDTGLRDCSCRSSTAPRGAI